MLLQKAEERAAESSDEDVSLQESRATVVQVSSNLELKITKTQAAQNQANFEREAATLRDEMKKLQQDLDSFSDREKAFTKEVADLKKEREGIRVQLY